MQAKLLQLCPTLWHLMDYSSAGSSVHLLEWVAMLCSRGFSWPRDQRHRDMGLLCLLHWQAGSLPIAPPGKPINRASQVAQIVKNLPAIQETWIWSLGWEWLPTSSILAWRIPWTEKQATVRGVATEQLPLLLLHTYTRTYESLCYTRN